jgi:dTDP-4-amino-4,6-dideoxygalactose transaminase
VLPAFTCVVVPNAILYCGAQPVYVDIEPHSFNMDVARLEEKITPRTKAIIAQHTFGLICDIEGLQRIAAKHNIPVLEDCAHALGASYHGRPVGSLATAAFFSTDHTKIIGTGTGGMVTTNDESLAAAIAEIQRQAPFLEASRIRIILAAFIVETILQHPRLSLIGKYLHVLLWRAGLVRGFFLDEMSETKPSTYAYPARLANAQAAIGLSQLDDLQRNLSWRRRLARMYDEEMEAFAGLLEPDYANHAFLRYPFMVENRQAWEHHLADVLDMGVWFTSVTHGRDHDLEKVGYRMGSCPAAEDAAAHCVNLPTHLRVTNPEILLRLLRSGRKPEKAELRQRRFFAGSTSRGRTSN